MVKALFFFFVFIRTTKFFKLFNTLLKNSLGIATIFLLIIEFNIEFKNCITVMVT